MAPSEELHQLHIRSAKGEPLTPEERARLQEWYELMDWEERAALTVIPRIPTLDDLREDLRQAYARLTEMARRIKSLTDENDALRREVDALRRQQPEKRAGGQPKSAR